MSEKTLRTKIYILVNLLTVYSYTEITYNSHKSQTSYLMVFDCISNDRAINLQKRSKLLKFLNERKFISIYSQQSRVVSALVRNQVIVETREVTREKTWQTSKESKYL